jgi:transcriptional regulator with XRE-family HTH domain
MQAFISNMTSKIFAWNLAFQIVRVNAFISDAGYYQTEAGEAMPEVMTGSTVPRRQLGRYLRDLRNQAGILVKDAAKQLEWSEAKLWRIETGQTSLRSLDVEAMCRVYGAPPDMTEALMGLAKETKARGWWQAYGDAVPEWFDLFVGLEAAASRLSWYEQQLVPGLFQTEDYARTLIRAHNPDEDNAETERRVRLRMGRQAIVRRMIDPPAIQVALDESVLRRAIGGAEIMAGQLARLAEASDLPNVSLKVVPFSVGFHPGVLSGPFVFLRFPLNGGGTDSEPPTVYTDIYTGALYLDKPSEIERYSEAFAGLWQHALDEPSSRELIRNTAEALRHG